MAGTLGDTLVVAISSRALFDLDDSYRLCEAEGIAAYRQHQIAREEEVLARARPARLWRAAGARCRRGSGPDQEGLVSRNSADSGLRVFNSIQYSGHCERVRSVARTAHVPHGIGNE